MSAKDTRTLTSSGVWGGNDTISVEFFNKIRHEWTFVLAGRKVEALIQRRDERVMNKGNEVAESRRLRVAITVKNVAEFPLALIALVFWALDQFTDLHWARDALLFCALTLLLVSYLERRRQRNSLSSGQ